MTQKISPEYLEREYRIRPGDRLHRLIAMLCDTYIDDLSDERISELEEHIAQFRWMTASGERLDK